MNKFTKYLIDGAIGLAVIATPYSRIVNYKGLPSSQVPQRVLLCKAAVDNLDSARLQLSSGDLTHTIDSLYVASGKFPEIRSEVEKLILEHFPQKASYGKEGVFVVRDDFKNKVYDTTRAEIRLSSMLNTLKAQESQIELEEKEKARANNLSYQSFADRKVQVRNHLDYIFCTVLMSFGAAVAGLIGIGINHKKSKKNSLN